ncbi:hypothetical protein SAMN05444851_2331 [Aliiroseovarius sediminilitoris]|uniref:Uncharacterized protein n=1 Tax=Aliiroseovarius sediminilitoris TaxID=1173584 RepID=A0A1I0Q8B6_9RHOB|nr:hypothetical protein SAMN05444851_2331 [Aliiroseovarius sediminilitoris]
MIKLISFSTFTRFSPNSAAIASHQTRQDKKGKQPTLSSAFLSAIDEIVNVEINQVLR